MKRFVLVKDSPGHYKVIECKNSEAQLKIAAEQFLRHGVNNVFPAVEIDSKSKINGKNLYSIFKSDRNYLAIKLERLTEEVNQNPSLNKYLPKRLILAVYEPIDCRIEVKFTWPKGRQFRGTIKKEESGFEFCMM